MANRFLPLRTGTLGKVPTTADLLDGEICTNYTDGKIYQRVGATVYLIGNVGVPAATTLAGYGITDGAPIDAPTFTTNLDTNGLIRSTTHVGFRTTGVGIEMFWHSVGLYGALEAYDRTNLTFQPVRILGSNISLWAGGTNIAQIDSTGVTATAYNGLALTNTIASGVTDLSKQIALWANYGFSITANRLNYVVPTGASHRWVINGVDIAYADSTGLFYGGIEVGYRNVPMTVKNAAYTFVNTDKGKGICHTDTTARAYTVPTGFTQGDILTVANETGTGACTIVPGSGMTMYLAGTATTGTRTLAVRGIASIYIGSGGTSCYVSGPGVT